jgi:hypothetical protein
VPTRISCPDGSHPSDDGTSCERDQPDCPDGQHRDDDGTCVPDRSADGCPPGTHAKSTLCVSDDVPTCADGQHVSYTNKCIENCPDGYHQAARDNCVPIPAPCSTGVTHGTVRSECGTVTGRRPGRRQEKGGTGRGETDSTH